MGLVIRVQNVLIHMMLHRIKRMNYASISLLVTALKISNVYILMMLRTSLVSFFMLLDIVCREMSAGRIM
jgi:hypothetical protein